MKKLLILDKDGTITEPISGGKFVQHPTDQKLIEGVSAAIKEYTDLGYLIVIASNQAGVAAGYKTLEDAILEMRFAMKLTGVTTGYFCADFEGETCYEVGLTSVTEIHKTDYGSKLSGTFRKPGTGMIKYCMASIPNDFTVFVGDRPEDRQAAMDAGVSFYWADSCGFLERNAGSCRETK
jgi:D-glycero-D-manno-heptose 1,7-bisphosphate phosphatase